jgi:hypothetical protein
MPGIFVGPTPGPRSGLIYAAMPTAVANALVDGTSGGTGSGFSWSGWIDQTQTGGSSTGYYGFELTATGSASSAIRIWIGVSASRYIRFEVFNATTSMRCERDYTISNNRWVRFGVSWDGGLSNTGAKLYIDGAEFTVASSSRDGVGACPAPLGTIGIGCSPYGSTRDHVGRMHKVGMWRKVLTADQFARLHGTGYRVHDPNEIEAADLILNVPFDADSTNAPASGVGTAGAPTLGSVTMTNRFPGDIPGVGFWYKAESAGNTITGGRIATALDYAGSARTAIETSTSGPAKTTDTGLGIAHGSHLSDGNYYLSHASASGLHVNASDASILAFVSAISTQAFVSRNEPRYIAALGDPATGGAGEAELWVSVDGFPVGGEAGTTARTTGNVKRMDAASPRLMGAIFRTGGVDVWADDEITVGATPCTAATNTGFRLFAVPGTTDYWFEGRSYDVLIYQHAMHADDVLTVRAAFRDADATAGVSGSYFSEAVGLIATVGSSSMFGYMTDWRDGLLVAVQPSLADRIVYNFAQVSAGRSALAGVVNTHLQAADVLALFPKANRHAIIQPFGNDNDGSGTFGYGGSTTFASVLSDIQATVTDLLTDYAKVGHWETIARGSIGTDTDTTISVRERDRQSLFSGLANVYRFNFDSIVGLAVTQSVVDATLAANVNTITTGPNYNADEIHLNNTGFALLATQFNAMIDGLFLAGNVRWRSSPRATRCR